MIIYNGAQDSIVVRAFAAGRIIDFGDMVHVAPKSSATVPGPMLPEYNLKGPYLILQSVLVRDWGKLTIRPTEEMPSVVLRPGVANVFKVPFSLNPTTYEGFQVAFLVDSELIRFWYPMDET